MNSEDIIKAQIVTTKKGRKCYLIEKYKFCFHKTLVNNIERWCCSHKQCKAYFTINAKGESFRQDLKHNHPAKNVNHFLKKKQDFNVGTISLIEEYVYKQPDQVIRQNSRKCTEDLRILPTTMKLCRLCACQKPMELLISFRGTVYEKAMKELSPLGLLSPNHQGFPEEVCQNCAQELLEVQRKIQKFCEADRKLLTLVKSPLKIVEDDDFEEDFVAVQVKLEDEVITIKEEVEIPETRRGEDTEMREVETEFIKEEVNENFSINEYKDRR